MIPEERNLRNYIQKMKPDEFEDALIKGFINLDTGVMILPLSYQAIEINTKYRSSDFEGLGCSGEICECDPEEKRKCGLYIMVSTFYDCIRVSMGTLPKDYLMKYAEEDYLSTREIKKEEAVSKEEFEEIRKDRLNAIYEEIEKRKIVEVESKTETGQEKLSEKTEIEEKSKPEDEKSENEKISIEEKMRNMHLKMADAFFEKGNYLKAIENYNKILDKNKDDAYAFKQKARCEEEMNVFRQKKE